MKLILTNDVSSLGHAGDIVTVKDGFGRNYLIPQGFATPWTKGGEKQVTQIKRARRIREVRDSDHANEIKVWLESAEIMLPARTSQSGKLFGSVTTNDVALAVKAAGGPILDKRKIKLANAIKSLGNYQVNVELHSKISAKLKLKVVPAE